MSFSSRNFVELGAYNVKKYLTPAQPGQDEQVVAIGFNDVNIYDYPILSSQKRVWINFVACRTNETKFWMLYKVKNRWRCGPSLKAI